MLFRQRRKPGFTERLRLSVWPRVSFRRSVLYYVKRTLRLSGTPHAVAMGAAVGAGVACTPFLGFHFIITGAVAWLLRGNIIAGAIASCVGNPLTYPVLWAGSYELGKVMLGELGRHAPPRLEHDLLHESWSQLWPVIEPMALGSIPIGLAVGSMAYFLTHKAVSAYQSARRERLSRHRHPGAEPGRDDPALVRQGQET